MSFCGCARNRRPLNIALLLTGFQTIVAIFYFGAGIINNRWKEIGVSNFVVGGVHYLTMVCIFISLIIMLADEKPFTRTLTICMRVIASSYLLGSLLFPRLPGYQTDFGILTGKNFALIDGNILMLGVLFYILSSVIYEGFAIQKEVEEIL